MKKYLRFAENYILLLASATLGLFLLLFAPKDGVVKAIYVKKDQTVSTGDPLFLIG